VVQKGRECVCSQQDGSLSGKGGKARAPNPLVIGKGRVQTPPVLGSLTLCGHFWFENRIKDVAHGCRAGRCTAAHLVDRPTASGMLQRGRDEREREIERERHVG
jgi:hypothetical protein